jgi:prophage regulatory protein
MNNIYDDELLRLEQVLRALKCSKSAFYAGIKVGRFPTGVALGPRARRWRGKDIKSIIEEGVKK